MLGLGQIRSNAEATKFILSSFIPSLSMDYTQSTSDVSSEAGSEVICSAFVVAVKR